MLQFLNTNLVTLAHPRLETRTVGMFRLQASKTSPLRVRRGGLQELKLNITAPTRFTLGIGLILVAILGALAIDGAALLVTLREALVGSALSSLLAIASGGLELIGGPLLRPP